MSRLSLAALVIAFAAFAIGVVGPVLDRNVLRAQLAFAGGAAESPPPEAEKQGLRAEAERWITRKIRERNDAAEGPGRPRSEPADTGLFGTAAPHIVTVQFVLALLGLALALADWLRTRSTRPNLMAGTLALSAFVLPFAWSAIAVAVTIAAVIVLLAIVGSVLG